MPARTPPPAPSAWRGGFLLRWVFVAAGAALVLAPLQTATALADRRLESTYSEYRNYLGELAHLFSRDQAPVFKGARRGEGERGWGSAAWGVAGRAALREGGLAALAILTAAILAARGVLRGRRRLAPPLVFFAVLAVFWALYPWKLERSWGMVVLAGWMLAGGVLADLLAAEPRLLARLAALARPTARLLAAAAALTLLAHLLFLAAIPWRALWAQRSPLPAAAREALAWTAARGGRIHASSFGESFGPVWKWALIEAAREPALARARETMDFSSFEEPDVVFLDPRVWDSPVFRTPRAQVEGSRLIAAAESDIPHWRVEARDLRFPAGPPPR